MRKIVAALFAVLIVGCTTIDCPVQNSVETGFTLKKPNGTIDTLNTDTLTVWTHRINYSEEEGIDTVLINRLCGAKGTTFNTHISHTQPEDTLFTVLEDNKGNAYLDTICILKENYPHFESVDCHATYFHKITAIKSTRYGIDSIILNKPAVNYDKQTDNIYLYLKADR